MTRLCEDCANKLSTNHDIEIIGGLCVGFCPVCWQMTQTQNYEITPLRIYFNIKESKT